MSLPENFSTVIFDMDGVLWHTNDAHAEAFRQIFEPFHLAAPAYKEIAGRRTDEVIQSVMAAAGIELTPEKLSEMIELKREAAGRIISLKPPVADSCYEVLEQLSRQHRLGLVSSASASSVNLFLQTSSTDKFFDMIMSGECIKRSKPAPDIYIEACRRLGVNASEVVVVEDAISGIRAAKNAGIKVIAVRGTSPEEELKREDVLLIINNLRELL